jgi:SnoaL-like domain
VTAPSSSAAVVRRIHERMQARDWAAVRLCVTDDAVIEYPVTGERFRGQRWVDMNEAYPEGWAIEVAEIVDHGDRAAARVRVTMNEAEVSWCAGFYSTDGERIIGGIELWSTDHGEVPPDWRCSYWA